MNFCLHDTKISEFLIEQGCVSSAPESGTFRRTLPLTHKPAGRHGCCSLVSVLLFSNPSISAAKKHPAVLCVYERTHVCVHSHGCSFWTHTMGAPRILTSRTWTWESPAGEQGSREKLVEEEAVGSRAEAGDSSFTTRPLLPSETWG